MKQTLLGCLFFCVLFSVSAQTAVPQRIVTDNPIMTDVIANVGGDLVTVTTVTAETVDNRIIIGGDGINDLLEADLIVVKGVGLEALFGEIARVGMEASIQSLNENVRMIGYEVIPGESAVYMTLTNTSDQAITLVATEGSWFAPFYGVILHETMIMNDMAMMHTLDDLIVPAGGTIVLEPASQHLMFKEIDENLDEGTTLPLVLRFSDGSEIAVPVSVALEKPAVALPSAQGARITISDAWVLPLQTLFTPASVTLEQPYIGVYGDTITCVVAGPKPRCNPFVEYSPAALAQWARNAALYMGDYDPDPAHAAIYTANADAYIAELDALDARIRVAFDVFPAARRAVNIPDSVPWLAYFAAEYGLEDNDEGIDLPYPPAGLSAIETIESIAEAIIGRSL